MQVESRTIAREIGVTGLLGLLHIEPVGRWRLSRFV